MGMRLFSERFFTIFPKNTQSLMRSSASVRWTLSFYSLYKKAEDILFKEVTVQPIFNSISALSVRIS
jgi:hypothetical protein